jgi:hypothetical protein
MNRSHIITMQKRLDCAIYSSTTRAQHVRDGGGRCRREMSSRRKTDPTPHVPPSTGTSWGVNNTPVLYHTNLHRITPCDVSHRVVIRELKYPVVIVDEKVGEFIHEFGRKFFPKLYGITP